MDSLPYQKIINDSNEVEVTQGLKWSLGLHVGLVLFLMLKTYFVSNDVIDYESAIRVDLVGLPDKIDPKQLAPAEPIAPPPKEKSEPPPAPPPAVEKEKLPDKSKIDPDSINLDAVKKKQQQALNKLKSLSAIEQIKKNLEESKKQNEKDRAQKAATQIKGNILSPGTELTGLNKLQHENYVGQIDRQIKQNWSIPEWLAKKDYQAQVLLKLDEKGLILSRHIVKSSGNANYDDAVLETIDKSAPYPSPPEKLIAIVGARGLLIGFPE
ncbi:MAG: TonB family protein [Bdellovibrionota bacterium]